MGHILIYRKEQAFLGGEERKGKWREGEVKPLGFSRSLAGIFQLLVFRGDLGDSPAVLTLCLVPSLLDFLLSPLPPAPPASLWIYPGSCGQGKSLPKFT